MNKNVNRYTQGPWRLLIKMIVAIFIVFIIEKLLGMANNKDPLGLALLPFHNRYIAFPKYFLTNIGLAGEFSNGSSATTRFAIYTLLGYLGYAVISMIIYSIPALKKISAGINRGLFYLMLLMSFSLAFFFPRKLSVIDCDKKEVRVTTYTCFFIPSTQHIPFNTIDHVKYDLISDYDGYNKEYLNILSLVAVTKNGKTTQLGEIQVGAQKGTLTNMPPRDTSVETKRMAENVVMMLGMAVQ